MQQARTPGPRLLVTKEEKREGGRRNQGEDEEDMPGDDSAVQQEVRGFSVKETVIRQTVSSSNADRCEKNINLNTNHLYDVDSLHQRVNNLSVKKRKT